MVRRLAVAGYRLRVWNRSSAKADACRGPAIDVCRSPAEALQGVETVFLCLTDAKAVSDVVFTDPEALLRWGVFCHCGRFLHHRHGRDASICGQPGECQRRHLDRRTDIGRRRRCHLWNPRHFRGGQWPKHRTRVTALRPLARCITYLAAMGGRVSHCSTTRGLAGTRP